MSKHDEKVKSMLDLLEKKKSELGKKPSGVLRTNGVCKFDNGNHINLNTINDIDVAINTYASILMSAVAFEQACEELGVDRPYIYNGYSKEDWVTDLKLRIDIIKWNTKQAEFNALSKKLDSLISEDLRTEKELENIAELLK